MLEKKVRSDQVSDQVIDQVSDQVVDQVVDQIKKVLKYCKTPKSRLEVLSIMGISNHFYNFKRHILPLIEQNLIEYTKKENSKDRNQKYVTTQKGNSRLKG